MEKYVEALEFQLTGKIPQGNLSDLSFVARSKVDQKVSTEKKQVESFLNGDLSLKFQELESKYQELLSQYEKEKSKNIQNENNSKSITEKEQKLREQEEVIKDLREKNAATIEILKTMERQNKIFKEEILSRETFINEATEKLKSKDKMIEQLEKQLEIADTDSLKELSSIKQEHQKIYQQVENIKKKKNKKI